MRQKEELSRNELNYRKEESLKSDITNQHRHMLVTQSAYINSKRIICDCDNKEA